MREKENFSLLVHSTNGNNSQARLKPRSRNSVVGDRDQSAWDIFFCLHKHISKELDQKWSNWYLN